MRRGPVEHGQARRTVPRAQQGVKEPDRAANMWTNRTIRGYSTRVLERILIVAAIALVMGLVLWVIIRRASGSQEPAPRPLPRSSMGPGQGPRSVSAPSLSGSGAVPSVPADSLAAQLNWLVGIAGDVQGKTFHVANRIATIGRGLGNFIQTTDPDASRVHCQFMPVPGGLQIKDMESSNGTFVNGQQITVRLLKDGDQVRIGKAVVVYRARADFGVDHSLQRKVAGASAAKQTQMGGIGDLRTMLIQAMQKAEGNIVVAAQNMGMQPQHLASMLQQYNISPNDWNGPPRSN